MLKHLKEGTQLMAIYTPYTYLIGWTTHNKWYYGVRYSKVSSCLYESGCHPDDLWVTYFTSSAEVKIFVEKYGHPDVVQVRKTFVNSKKAQDWEDRVLKRIFKNKDKWLNKRFGGSRFSPNDESIEKCKTSKKNRSKDYDLVVRKNISEGSKIGHANRSPETKLQVSEKVREQNRNRDKSINRKIAKSVSNRWNSLSDQEKNNVIEKRKKTMLEKKELGIKKKKYDISLISCLCCHKVFNKGNFSRHIKKIQE